MRHYSFEECVRNIQKLNAKINAVTHLCLDEARGAHQVRKKEKPKSPLHGVPYVLKDVWDVADLPSTGGSYRHRHRIPKKSGNVHRALEKAGAVLLGKSNIGDLAISPESANFLVGSTNNPHDLTRTSGGSTGGGAAAVATGMAAFDWGSDMGGSIRHPVANCGVVGLRLSSSCWPHEGHFPRVPEALYHMNGMGPITRTLQGCRQVLNTLAPSLRTGDTFDFRFKGIVLYGPDRWSRAEWPNFSKELIPTLNRADILIHGGNGLPTPWQANTLYNAYLSSHLDKLFQTGEFNFWEAISSVTSALTIGHWFQDRRIHPLTAQTLALLALGKMTIYRDARKYRDQVSELHHKVESLWRQGYILVTPTTTYSAPKHGKALLTWSLLNFVKFGNLIDATALAFPWGKFPNGLPRSLQLIGPPGSEQHLLDLAERLTQVTRE